MFKIDKEKTALDLDAKPSGTSGKDNRNLNDQDSNQKLSKDDIDKMKKGGMDGQVTFSF